MITWFRNMKTKTKLLTAFAFMAILITVLGIILGYRVLEMKQMLNALYDDRLVPAIDLGQMTEQAYGIARTALRITYEEDPAKRQEFYDGAKNSAKEFERLLEKYAAAYSAASAEYSTHMAEEKKIIDELKNAWNAWRPATFHTYELAMQGKVNEAKENAFVAVPPKFKVLSEKLKRLIAIQDEVGKDLYKESADDYNQAKYIMVISIVVAIILAFSFGFVLARMIATPLKEMAASAQRIASGELDVQIEARSKDEVGILANAFKEMISYLKGMAHTAEAIAEGDLRGDVAPKSEKDTLGNAFKKMITGLRDIVGQLRGGSDQVASASSEIAATAEQSSRNSEGAATAVEEITSTIHEMSANIQNVAKSIQYNTPQNSDKAIRW